MAEIKRKILDHIQEYWIDGPLPCQVCRGRKGDLTNNKNEGHNSYFNNALKKRHPSPAKFNVAIVKMLKITETIVQMAEVSEKEARNQLDAQLDDSIATNDD